MQVPSCSPSSRGEMVNAAGLNPVAFGHVGSTPTESTSLARGSLTVKHLALTQKIRVRFPSPLPITSQPVDALFEE